MKGQLSFFSRPRKRSSSSTGDWLRIGFMGALLAALLWVFFHSSPPPETSEGPAIIPAEISVPTLDPQVMAKIKDGTREERLLLEPEPYSHLLAKSLRVVPAVAKALGMPENPVPVAMLRSNPDHWRGRYLWYKGTLQHLSEPRPAHPVANYKIYEGDIRTAEGETVLFAVSVPPPPELKIGDWVRVEGFFMKLRDMHLPISVDQAPLLVGPELIAAFPDWKSVEALDSEILARVKDDMTAERMLSDDKNVGRGINEMQDVPLWHVASYAIHEEHDYLDLPVEKKEQLPTFNTNELWTRAYEGKMERGAPFRLLGLFRQGRIVAAKANPLGIDYWSELWLLNRNFGTRPFPVWIPRRVPALAINQSVVCYGYFFKRYTYQGGDVPHYAPLFVAADVYPFAVTPNQANHYVALAFGILVLLFAALFFWLARRDSKERRTHEETLVARRRRRRDNAVPAPET